MKPKLLFTASAIYLALAGLGMFLLPQLTVSGALTGVPVDVVSLVRGNGASIFAFGVLLWFARDADASKARNAIFVASAVAAGSAAVLDVWGLLGGGPVFLGPLAVVDALLAVAFILVGRANTWTPGPSTASAQAS